MLFNKLGVGLACNAFEETTTLPLTLLIFSLNFVAWLAASFFASSSSAPEGVSDNTGGELVVTTGGTAGDSEIDDLSITDAIGF